MTGSSSSRRSFTPASAPGVRPLVSVIVPVRNEERFVQGCLTAILEQDYPPERLEILVADGMSEDRTREFIATLPAGGRIRVIDNPARLQAAGLNLCIAAARGDVLIRVDGHTVIARDYVATCVDTLAETGAWSVGGAITGGWTTPMGRAIAVASSSPFAVPGAFHSSVRACFTDTVYLGAWPADVIRSVNGFRAELAINEDYELNHRIRSAGGRIFYSPKIRCTYFGRQTIPELGRQYFRYGRGKVEVLARHPRSLKWRHLVAPAFVAALVATPALSIWTSLAALIWLATVLAYVGANLLASIKIALREGVAVLPAVALAFATMHVCWGAGFWREVFSRSAGLARPGNEGDGRTPGTEPFMGAPSSRVRRLP